MVLEMGALQYGLVRPALAQSNLTTVGQYMFWLMFRNVASDGLVFEDPVRTGVLSQPGCVLASPSWENTATHVTQDYVYNWTHDAAVVALELAAGGLSTAIPWLQNALAGHWNGQYYQSLLPVPTDFRAPYDPNIDIVMAAIYGAVPVTDTKLLATAELLRSQWADPASKYFYPINGADQQLGIGPMPGRYPGDTYDGDTDAQVGDHPWAVSTANFAELYYRLAKQVTTAGAVPLDNLSAGFFSQIGISASTTPAAAAAALQSAGDQMLQAIVFHSDHFELSEQFDAITGYEKSVSNLSWSYASFLSAIRAKNHLRTLSRAREPAPTPRRPAITWPTPASRRCARQAIYRGQQRHIVDAEEN